MKKWEETGELTPITKTSGGHRRYRQSDVYRLMGVSEATENADITAAYVIQVAVEPDDKAAFDAWCMANSTTMSEVIRQEIAPYIAKGKKLLEDQA
ncbi:MAG: MerR family transcriptional regulator [Cyanobacteriota bacterium]